MTTTDVGDIATLALTVAPSAPDTSATLTVVSPTGTTTSPTTTPNGDRSVWTALLPLTAPGVWLARWTVTGTGAGVEQQTVTARPVLPVVVAGQRVYATTADLADYLEAAPPADARRMLRRASARVDDMLTTAVYAADAITGHPTDAAAIAALRDATCAQVEWWIETGDESGAASQMQQVSIGSVSLGRGYTGKGSATGYGQTYSEEAVGHLRRAGLLGHGPYSWSGPWG